ncbi:MAG: ABC transporter substrate-binding protein [Vallitaleaceae bacterium]|nr:ABC transporter substrate-binding protein [Vallitaleaceae bacterium]
MKKVLALMMVVLSFVSVLSGCGQKSNTTDNNTTTTTVAESEVTTEAVTEAPKKDPVTIKWYMLGDDQEDLPLVLEEINKLLTPKTNAILDLQLADFGSFNDKMKLIITSGEDYDLTFTSNWMNDFNANMSINAFRPLDDLIAKVSPNFYDIVPESVMDVSKVNGQHYAVPNQQILATQWGFFVQKEYADKYGLDVTTIKKPQDLEPFLEQIKNNEPDVYPAGSYSEMTKILYCQEGIYESYFDADDAKLTALNLADLDITRNIYDVVYNWFDKGYLRKDSITVTDDTADKKANKYVVTFGVSKPGGLIEMNNSTGIEWVGAPLTEPYLNADAGMPTMNAMNINCQNPEEAMKVLEVVNSDKEIYNLLVFGIEGTHYDLVDGFVQVREDSKYKMNGVAWAIGNQFNALYQVGQAPDTWEITKKLNDDAKVSALRGFTFNPEAVQTEIAQTTAVNDEFGKMLYFRGDNRDGLFDDYREKLKNAGNDAVIAEYQRQVDEWSAANGK